MGYGELDAHNEAMSNFEQVALSPEAATNVDARANNSEATVANRREVEAFFEQRRLAAANKVEEVVVEEETDPKIIKLKAIPIKPNSSLPRAFCSEHDHIFDSDNPAEIATNHNKARWLALGGLFGRKKGDGYRG